MSELKVRKTKGIVFGKDESKETKEGKYVSYKHNTYLDNCPVSEDTLQEMLNYSKEYSEAGVNLAVKQATTYFEENDDAEELSVTYPFHKNDTFKVTVVKEKEIDGEISPRIFTEMKVDDYDHREYIMEKEKKLAKLIAEM